MILDDIVHRVTISYFRVGLKAEENDDRILASERGVRENCAKIARKISEEMTEIYINRYKLINCKENILYINESFISYVFTCLRYRHFYRNCVLISLKNEQRIIHT